MKIAMHQPMYVPWLGYFEKIDACDLFVVVDDVQFEKGGWQNRNKVRASWSPEGWLWLTIPIQNRFPQMVNEAEIVPGGHWCQKHLRTLEAAYGRAPFFMDYFPALEAIIGQRFRLLSELNVALLRWLLGALGIEKEIISSSSMSVSSHPTMRPLEICRACGAEQLLLGTGSLNYLDRRLFRGERTTLLLQDYQHPDYPQIGRGFVSHLSILDLLFNHGPRSLSIIRSGRRWVDYPDSDE